MLTASEVLETVFGHRQFRGMQHEIIETILAKQHALVIYAHRHGQKPVLSVPALMLAKRHRSGGTNPRPLTIVISPLIALMKDQVDALNQKGISAAFVNSSLTIDQRRQRIQQIENGDFDLLYVTPERFRKPDFLAVLAPRQIVLLAVDEAHCISEWGHDFRPDYTRVGDIRHQLGCPTTIALTATATPDVQVDIARQLGLNLHRDSLQESSAATLDESSDSVSRRGEMRLFQAGIERPNLALEVVQVWDDDEKLNWIRQTREELVGSGIVYFTLIRKLQEFSDQLWAENVPHLIYHGELPRDQRRRLQESFMQEDGHLVLATNAFGMGIDKEDIRFVLHADLPGSLESYYQEIGRAGRDGHPSKCLLLYDQRDLATQMEFLQWSNPDAEFYSRVYDFLLHETQQVNGFGIEWLRERLHAKQKHDRRLETVLGMLDRWGVIEGTLEPLQINGVNPLPNRLRDSALLAEKLKRDQKKLLAMVEYANLDLDKTQNRRQYLQNYFSALQSL